MSLRRIPVDARRLDWPRLVAETVNAIIGKINLDPISRAENTVLKTYGDAVSVEAKGKTLNKFGRNAAVGTSFETVAEFQSTTANETFVSTNIIDSIASDDQTNDVGIVITIEGHTIDGSGNLTFVVQDATLDGTDARTEVTLTTPLARANRAYVKASGTFDSPQATPTGNIYVYDNTDGQTAGVPTTAAATKLMILAGENQSEKAGTSISSQDYWFIADFSCAVSDATGPTNFATVRMETRDVVNGGVWRPLGRDYILWPDINGIQRVFNPYLIVPKNHDWRVRAKCDAGSSSIDASANGILAAIQ